MDTAPIESPLATADGYRFTEPRNADLVRGRLTGPDPAPHRPLLGEDQIYLFEAMNEMSAVSEAAPNYSFAKASGIDTRYLRRPTTARVGAVWGRLYVALSHSADATSWYGGGLVLADAEIGGAEPSIWDGSGHYVVATRQYYTRYARDSVLASGAAAGPVDGMADFVAGSRRRLSSSSVAAFYRAIAAVSGFANDYDASQLRLVHADAGVQHYYSTGDIESFNSETGEYAYADPFDEVANVSFTGGGLYDTSSQTVSMAKKIYGPESAKKWSTSKVARWSGALTSSFDEPVTAKMFSADFAGASRLSCRKAWVVAEVRYGDTEYIWNDSATREMTVNEDVTELVAVDAVDVSFSESDGSVVATATPSSYAAAYNAFFAAHPSLHPPDDGYFPPAPVAGAWKEGESDTKSNGRDTYIQIRPKRLALVVDVDWHTGFHRLGVGSGA